MKVTVIGSGNVGKTLTQNWRAAGHTVTVGAHEGHPKTGDAVPIEQAIVGTDVIVLAVPFAAAQELVRKYKDAWSGRVVIDCTNPLQADLRLSVGLTTSGIEQLDAIAPAVRWVKAFNTMGWENMATPAGKTMWICGDDAAANQTVSQLAASVGFAPCVTGPLYHARYLEPMACLWIDMAVRQHRPHNFVFQFVETVFEK